MKRLAILLMLASAGAVQAARPVEEFSTGAGTLKITLLGHASLVLEAGGQVVYVDPAGQGASEATVPGDLILYTHTHGDHLDPKLLAKLRKASTAVIGPEAVAAKVEGCVAIRAGETRSAAPWTIEAVPAYNIKRERAPGVVFHPKGEGIGYVVGYGGKRIYIAGDTEGTPEMKALKNIDVAFVPMNLPFTMTPEEAAEALRAFAPKVVYPYHYRGADLQALQKALAGTNIEVRIREWY